MLFNENICFYLCECVCMYAGCMCMLVQVPSECRKGYQVSWNYSYSNCEIPNKGSEN